MNTDNTAVSGETIDYGPCAFMDEYAPETVFSSIDQSGRYAYRNQPAIAQWNLARLAETLLPLFHPDQDTAISLATESLNRFGTLFQSRWLEGMRAKIGLTGEQEGDAELIQSLLGAMHQGDADFTNTFRSLGEALIDDAAMATLREGFRDSGPFDAWLPRWQARLAEEAITPQDRSAAMNQVNPAVIPRNHLVERALAAAIDDDMTPFEDLLEVLQQPFQTPEGVGYRTPPQPEERVLQTFCGT
jgi:uncharacterized protein YdiU (UPF0061 family)